MKDGQIVAETNSQFLRCYEIKDNITGDLNITENIPQNYTFKSNPSWTDLSNYM